MMIFLNIGDFRSWNLEGWSENTASRVFALHEADPEPIRAPSLASYMVLRIYQEWFLIASPWVMAQTPPTKKLNSCWLIKYDSKDIRKNYNILIYYLRMKIPKLRTDLTFNYTISILLIYRHYIKYTNNII